MKGAEYEYERLANSVFVLRIVLCMRTVTCNALTPGRHFTYIPLRNFFYSSATAAKICSRCQCKQWCDMAVTWEHVKVLEFHGCNMLFSNNR